VATGVSGRARHYPFSNQLDPALPTGVWQADVISPGDASGGSNTADVLFSEAGVFDDGFYSLEQIADQDDDSTARIRQLVFANQQNVTDPATPITSLLQGAGLGGTANTSGWQGRDLAFLPYFIGAGPIAATGLQLFVRFRTINVDTVTYRIHAWGYRWGPGAWSSPTGPRRPANSIFG